MMVLRATSLRPCHNIDDTVLREARERVRVGVLGVRNPEKTLGVELPLRDERVGHLKMRIGDGSGIGGGGGKPNVPVPARD